MEDQPSSIPRWRLDPLTECIGQVKSLAEKVERLEEQCVTQKEYEPIRKIVVAVVGLILLAFMSGLITLVWNSKPQPQVIQQVPASSTVPKP